MIRQRKRTQHAGAIVRRHPRRRNCFSVLCITVLLSVLLGVVLLISAHRGTGPRLYIATSFSMPRGLYWRTAYTPARPLQWGDIVLFPVPAVMRPVLTQAAPALVDVPLMKPVAALTGDTVCLQGAQVLINGQLVAHRVAGTTQGHPLPWPEGCWTLDATQFFPLSLSHPQAIDGRYFSLVPVSSIQGRLTPLLLWKH